MTGVNEHLKKTYTDITPMYKYLWLPKLTVPQRTKQEVLARYVYLGTDGGITIYEWV